MNRAVLISLAALVLGAGIVLAVLIAKGDSSDSSASPTTSNGASNGTSTGPQPGSLDRTAPSLPNGVTLPSGDPNHPRDYAVGDINVRDHRSGDQKPLDIPPNVHPPEGPKIPSTITHDISASVLNVLKDCAADLPKDQRGAKPRLEGQIEISIKSGKTKINKATVQPRDVTEGPAADALKACMEQKSIGIQNNAPDQDDLDAYTINLSYAIP